MIENNSLFKPNASAILLFLALFVGAQLLFLPFIFLFNIPETNPFLQLFMYVFSFGIPIIGYYWLKLKPKKLNYGFDWKLSSPKIYMIILPLFIGTLFISEFLVSLIPIEGFFFGDSYKFITKTIQNLALSPWILLLITSVCAPILEEILFRGIFLKAMLNYNIQPLKAILVSSFMFGLIHANPWQFVGAFLLGVVIGLVFWKTQSLSNAILLHFINNFSASLLVIYFGNESFVDTFNWEWAYVLPICALICVAFTYLFLNYKNTPQLP